MAELLDRVRRWWRIRNAHHFEIRYREPGERGWRPIDTVVSFGPREFSVAGEREVYIELAEQENWPPGHYEVRAFEGNDGHQFGPQVLGWDVRLYEWEGIDDDRPEAILDEDDGQDGGRAEDDGEEVEPPNVDDQDDDRGEDEEENDAVITAEEIRWIDEHFPNIFN